MTPKTSPVKQPLSGNAVHKIWERNSRTPESEDFYERVFDWIAGYGVVATFFCGQGVAEVASAGRPLSEFGVEYSRAPWTRVE